MADGTPFLQVTAEKMKLFYKFCKLGLKIESGDKEWVYDEEPHTARRKAILKAHPEIKGLMGPDPLIAVIVLMEVLLQLTLCFLFKDLSWPVLVLLAYCVGGTINHSLGSAIHEIGHNLAFGHKYPKLNRALGILANLPMGIPLSVTYKKYHTDHHRYLGHEDLDVDIPTRLETRMFNYTPLRALWLFLYPYMQAVRPYYKSPLAINTFEIYNFIIQLSFDAFVFYFFGIKILFYLVGGTLLALGIHPLAGHFISEHYLFRNGHHATYSYYGPLNPILFNVGYHVEHHDFPYIPCTRLPKVREIAPEYYKHLPHHTSWIKVLWDFVFDPDMGPQSHGAGYVEGSQKLEEHAEHYFQKLPVSNIFPNNKDLRIGDESKTNHVIKNGDVTMNGSNHVTKRHSSIENGHPLKSLS